MGKLDRIINIRNLTAFWFLGLCNNFAYVIMLSAAEDILDKQEGKATNNTDETCEVNITSRHCTPVSTGAVLLADIIPTLIIKLTAPFFMHRIPFGVRHLIVVFAQAASYIIVAFSVDVWMSLLGVVFASIGSGLGEITYMALASHFSKNVISTWSSGTGGAGIFGALAYAGLTEQHLADLSPKTTLLIMLIVPVIFAAAYWILLVMPHSVHLVNIKDPKTWIVPIQSVASHIQDENSSATVDLAAKKKLLLVVPLLKYMIPLGLVYVGEYFINQGLVELIFFNCSHGWDLARNSQYRWYQVIYQLGVFISRSSVNVIQIKPIFLPLLAVLQGLNAVFFFFDAIYFFVPHIGIIFVLIIFEGLLGGASYVNTFHGIHQTVAEEYKEFSLGVATVADAAGIVLAGFASMPIHNFVCDRPLPKT
uniref:Battenin n=1 Tax=Plectus sambesii TaxID=2011161 RepID=A0A914ULM7_9BILA